MKELAEYVEALRVGEKEIRIGSKIQILKEHCWTKEKLEYPFQGTISKIIEEWDNGMRDPWVEDWGPTFITLEDGNVFYPGANLQLLEVLEY